MSRVLVPMSRETAEAWARPDLSADGLDAVALAGLDRASGQIHDAVIAALDTDRETLVKAIVRELYRQGVQFEGFIAERTAHAVDTAEAVLALLENGGQEADRG